MICGILYVIERWRLLDSVKSGLASWRPRSFFISPRYPRPILFWSTTTARYIPLFRQQTNARRWPIFWGWDTYLLRLWPIFLSRVAKNFEKLFTKREKACIIYWTKIFSFVLSVTRKNPSSESRELPSWAVSGSMSFSVCAPPRPCCEACLVCSGDVTSR